VWYEFDISWLTLKLFRAVGLVRDLKVAKVARVLDEEAA
jgi:fatty-acid desaturase